MPPRECRRGRRGRGRPPTRRRERGEAERSSFQEGLTTRLYALEPPPREPDLQPVHPPENVPPPQAAPPPIAPTVGLDPTTRLCGNHSRS